MSEAASPGPSSERIVEAVLADVRKGRMLILVDDEDHHSAGAHGRQNLFDDVLARPGSHHRRLVPRASSRS